MILTPMVSRTTPVPTVPVVESPCTKACALDADGICTGCRRSIAEIVDWPRLSPAERRAIMAELPRRQRG